MPAPPALGYHLIGWSWIVLAAAVPAWLDLGGRAWPAWLLLLYLTLLAAAGRLLERINDRRVAKMIDRAQPITACSGPLLVVALVSAIIVVVAGRRELVVLISFGALGIGCLRAAAGQAGPAARRAPLIAGLACLIASGLSLLVTAEGGRSWACAGLVGVSCTVAGFALNRRVLWAPTSPAAASGSGGAARGG
ncbi:MAG: hypothetical protein V3R77_04270 [Candidatus Binatia bacterium]